MKQLSQRQENILLSLKKLDYLNRDQLRKIHNLGKVRNANRILKELSPFLSSYREEYSTIYYLNSQGREYVNSKKVRKKHNFVNHILMRNDFYIHIGCPSEWKNEMRLRDTDYTVICDAWFKKNGFYHCLEVDLQQRMSENKGKIQRYKGLMKNAGVANLLGYFPKVIWITRTDYRKKQLKELCEGLPYEVYTIDEIQ